jgi:ketosteroid isomerase-like protein
MKQRIAVVFLWASLALGQTTPPHSPGRIVTTTRLVAIFSQLENQWLKAVKDKDQSTLDSLLADDFQVWMPMSDPVPREDWIRQAESEKPASFRIEHMAVRDLGNDTAIASFVLAQTMERDKSAVSEQHFVVDVWRKSATGWQATDRYMSRLRSSAVPSVTRDVKPTGKN